VGRVLARCQGVPARVLAPAARAPFGAGQWTQPLPAPASRDPDDDHVLACALAAKADLIVTRDLDLLDLTTYQGIPIVAAAEALRRIEAQR